MQAVLGPAVRRLSAIAYSATPLLVSTDWLHGQLAARTGLSVLDGSWYLPTAQRDPRREWASRRIPGAEFFDIDAVSSHDTPLPHMLPSAADFGVAMAALRVSKNRPVVVYDTAGLFSAPRVVWTLRAFGHPHVYLLSGGLPKWVAEGRPLATAPPPPLSPPEDDPEEWELDAGAVWKADAVLAAAARGAPRSDADPLLVDARPAGRFTGEVPEPRPGLAGGHVPGARSVPFSAVLDPAAPGEFLAPGALRGVLAGAGVPVDRAGTIMLSCGSGVTACVVWAALLAAGRDRSLAATPIYDGSWTEYAQIPGAPIARGPPSD